MECSLRQETNFELCTSSFESAVAVKNFSVQSTKHKVHGKQGLDPYLSISPSTISSDPIMATMSATMQPSPICGSAERFTKLGPRKCTREGFGPPSDFTYTPSSPLDASIGK